jgi:uncharacterized repeat protein (TIGR01451 family)
MKKLLFTTGLLALALAACTNPSSNPVSLLDLEDDGQEFVFAPRESTAQEFTAQGSTFWSGRLGAQAEGDIPTLKVRIGVKTRTSAAGTREKVASVIFKWADTTTLTGPVTIVTHEKGATGSLATKTANITSNSSLDAGVGYTGNTAFADPQPATKVLCVDVTWNVTTGANGYQFNQPNIVTFCQKDPPTAVADMSVRAITAPLVLNEASTGTLTVPVQNAGPSSALNVSVALSFPTGVQYQNVSGTSWICSAGTATALAQPVTCNTASLGKGSKNISLSVKGITQNANPYAVSASVSSPTVDPISSNNSRNYEVQVNTAGPISSVSDLSAKFAILPTTPALAVGSNVSATLNVTNVGPNDKAAGRTLSIVRSSSLTFVSASVNGLAGSCTEAAGTISCTLPAITANQNASVSIIVKPTAPGIVGLTADLATSSDDPANSNNTDSLSFTIPTP